MTYAAANLQDHSDIEALIREEVAAWNRGDAAAFAARTLPDVLFTNVVGRFSVGRGPFLAQHEHIFSTIYKGSHLTQKIENLAFVRSDVAILDTLTSGLSGTSAGRYCL